MLPGKKDFVSVKVGDLKEQKQKLLLLCNLNELYAAFKEKNPTYKIGFSKFCQLRPKWVITVGASGTHSVCVCTIHQNTKLMILCLPSKTDYHDLMKKIVCSETSQNCMIHRCESCHGKDALKAYLQDMLGCEYDDDDTISFQQWMSTDRTTLITQQLPLGEFIELLVNKVDDLTVHHYIAKHQSAYLTELKEKIPTNECIVILDFAENYSFIVQDAAQGFHWDNSQVTLHPFASYYQKEDSMCKLSLYVVSDCMRHNTVTVFAFQHAVIPYLKSEIPTLNLIHYFSDGAASQYKNFKNFANLRYHKHDFGVSAEWIFFATSHGKNPCDGIGGMVKRLAARASLQRSIDNQILTPQQFFKFCEENIHGITFFWISDEKVLKYKQDPGV